MMNTARLLSLLLVLAATAPTASGQSGLPVREYVNPEELVTLSRDTTFPQAVEILNGFSRRFADKILIDRTGRTGAIGLNIPNMPWKQALDYVVSFNNLVLREHTDYYEITAPARETTTSGSTGTTGTGAGTDPAVELPATLYTREIEISAIFFEGDRRVLEEIGVDWTTLKDGVVTVTNLAASNVSQEVFQIDIPAQSVGGGFEVSALISAFEANNVGELLSSPTIKVMDGQVGRIQVGQDFSIKQRDFAGNVIDNFFSTGTILEVTPTVITMNDTSFVHLSIKAERSSAQPDPVSTVINKQQAETQVLLFSGEQTVIAGLFETEETRVRRGVPVLKDLPVWFFGLRYLFGYNSTDVSEKELVVILKARIVPSLAERFGLPEQRLDEGLRQERDRLQEGIRRIREN